MATILTTLTNRKIMISEFSNSEIGSSHWFNTLVGNAMNIGQYLSLHGSNGISEITLREWGDELAKRSRALIEWHSKSEGVSRDHLIAVLEKTLKELKDRE